MNPAYIILAIGIMVLVIGIPLLMSITFGQKCTAAGYHNDSPAWHECVERLALGTK